MGILLSKMCQFFILSMHLSTCTLKQATFLLCSASSLVNCLRAFRKLAKTNVAPTDISSSLIKNPLSAMISSPVGKTVNHSLQQFLCLMYCQGIIHLQMQWLHWVLIQLRPPLLFWIYTVGNMQTDYQVIKACPFQTLCNL